MSAVPTGPPGSTPTGASAGNTPNGSAPSALRRPPKPKANPLVPPKRLKDKRAQARKPAPPGAKPPGVASNGTALQQKPAPSSNLYEEFKPPTNEFKATPVYTTKRALLEGLRHHIIKFQSKHPIDPTDQDEFTRPIRLHRRDAALGKSGAGADDGEEEENEEEVKERLRIEALKEERRRNREEVQAQIAPKAKGRTFVDNKKKIQQVYERNDTPESIKASRLRYEETLPWHLEDFDNKNTWVGAYEAALSDCHVMMVKEQHLNPATGQVTERFRMVPIEKWYKFSAKDKAVSMSLDDIEKQEKGGFALSRWALHPQGEQAKKSNVPKWMQQMEEQKVQKRLLEDASMRSKGLFLRSGGRGDDEEVKKRRPDDDDWIKTDAAPDADVIDYDEKEDFADDEEGVNGLFEGDDETTKDAEERIKREQLSANFFANKDETDVWKQEEEEALEAELKKKLEKSLRKKIVKREKNYNYDLDDSDENPYSEDSESEDSEAERQKEEERKKEEEKAAAEKGKGKVGETTEKTASGTSTKGSNTPSNRPKTSDPLKLSSSQALKRPGSPNLSEASGNESSRKKQRKFGGGGSDSEATDSGKPLASRVKHAASSQAPTPGGSRAGSPAVGGVASRAGSPSAPGGAGTKPRPPANFGPPPSVEEIRAVIPPEGASMQHLISKFKGRFKQGSQSQHQFIANVKAAGQYDKATKMIFRKP
ncbi:transcription initiation factor IIF subunit alpha [Macrophomina phaseolina]|uniref:Transcription initiation factor IIF subunit alpha n=1 Tax=Macrophomina phaseolina TaxID=35725 RepID=A0ABQ8G5E2_9PEZI|nr:transcription initiation factor IIF subunit alpha [Macrophomina phaseolina]